MNDKNIKFTLFRKLIKKKDIDVGNIFEIQWNLLKNSNQKNEHALQKQVLNWIYLEWQF